MITAMICSVIAAGSLFFRLEIISTSRPLTSRIDGKSNRKKSRTVNSIINAVRFPPAHKARDALSPLCPNRFSFPVFYTVALFPTIVTILTQIFSFSLPYGNNCKI